ncbi:MAG: M1 family aminopeptidase [Bacteroidota bacterium]
MFKQIFLFELSYRWKRPATWAYFGILFLFGFISAIYGNTPASEKTLANSPYSITTFLVVISIFGTLIAAAVMGVPVYRDIEHKVKDYYFTYPISEKGYLLGRYLGSLIFLFIISLGLVVGLILGFFLGPYLGLEEAERFGPFNLWHYIWPILTAYWPNFLLTGTLFFALVALTRKIFVSYVGSVLFFIAYLLANTLVQDLEMKNLVDLLDPYAFNTFDNFTKYWTPVEQNTQVVPMAGNILLNRIIWLGVALSIFLFVLWRFDFKRFLAVSSGKKMQETKTVSKTNSSVKIPKILPHFSSALNRKHMWRQARLEFINIIRDPYFLAMLIGGLLFLFLDGWFGSSIYGTPNLPITYYMIEVKDFTYIIFVFIIIIFYTGEVVHRDKSMKFEGISGALPVPNWVTYGGKFLGLILVAFFLVNLPIATGLLNQVLRGYFNFELDKYFTDLYLIEFPEYVQLVMLAFFVHILVNKKFLGHVVLIGVWLAMFGIRQIAEYDFNLFFYSYTPGYTLSDMNGFGHFFSSLSTFNLYWLALGTVLLILGNLLWSRGTDEGLRSRLKRLSKRLNPFAVAGLATALVLFLGLGIYIYYNTAQLNLYQTGKEVEKLSASYEKTYSKYANIPQPKITDVYLTADITPEDRSVVARAEMKLTNKSNFSIDSLHLSNESQIEHTVVRSFTIDDVEPELLLSDEDHRYKIYKLPTTLQPGDTVQMDIEVEASYKGFPNSGFGREVVFNGTFFNNSIFPSFGYNPGSELTSDLDRKKYGLEPKDYVSPPQDDSIGRYNLLFTDEADLVTYEAVISTSPDQIAVSPGYLIKSWEEGGRKYFHYKMKNKIQAFFNISSARYEVFNDTWTNPDGTKGNIEIFHHAKHTYNLDRFNASVKESMEYFSANFSPFQFRQMRLLEFPRYASFAQSFPNTVPYSEAFGWVGDFSDPDDTDYAFYVTAHEVAHQWWAHQLAPSATRGANQLSESMAQYSAYMVLKEYYGEAVMQKFLTYELDDYLSGRANESKFEKTLLDNDTQSYVWYEKGGIILYALQDYIGADSLNRAFSKLLDEFALKEEPPFATTWDWYQYMDAATPDSLKYYLEDSFKKITLYENKAKKAVLTPISETETEVTLTVDTRKVYYDGSGKESGEGTQPNLLEIGIFAKDSKNEGGITQKEPLYLQKHWLSPGEHTLTFTVSGTPEKAGIDPYNKMIDRIPEDNLIEVEGK